MEIVTLKKWVKHDLNPRLWRKLPNDMVMNILARLPLRPLFQARLICKEWDSFISSHKFLRIYNDNFFKHYYPIIMVKTLNAMQGLSLVEHDFSIPKKLVGYNQRQGQWEKLPTLKVFSDQAYSLADVAEGILCFRGVSNLFVYNLLMQTCTQLPPITDHWHMQRNSISISVDCNINSYQVTMVGWIYRSTILDRGVAIYKSTTKAWRTFNVTHPLQLDKLGLKMKFDKAIFLKDALYCKITNYISINNHSEIKLMIYNMQAKMWHDCAYSILPNDHYCPFSQVVQCGGDIYMVFISSNIFNDKEFPRELGVFKSIKVFKFDAIIKYAPLTNEYSKINEVKNAWRHVASEDIQDLSVACDYCIRANKIVCIGYKTQIYFSIGVHCIVYNVESHCWSRLESLVCRSCIIYKNH